MGSPDFTAMFNTIKIGVTNLAQTSLKSFTEQAKGEVQILLSNVQSNLQNWSADFASGKVDKDELNDMIGGQIAVLQEATLEQAGLLQIQIDQFKQGVISIVIDAVTKAL